jgi:Fasciclin domain
MLKADYQALQVLAPSNDAISDYLRLSGLPLNDTNAIFEAWVTYHILQGTHSKNQLQIATHFIPTLLTDANYNNVTGGQRVEAQSAGEQVYLLSGNKSRSNIVQAV